MRPAMSIVEELLAMEEQMRSRADDARDRALARAAARARDGELEPARAARVAVGVAEANAEAAAWIEAAKLARWRAYDLQEPAVYTPAAASTAEAG